MLTHKDHHRPFLSTSPTGADCRVKLPNRRTVGATLANLTIEKGYVGEELGGGAS